MCRFHPISHRARQHLLLILIACASVLQLAQASAVRKMGDSSRHDKFNAGRNPLDTLFTMKTERRDDLQNQMTEMIKQTRLHADAKKKVQEEMARIDGKRRSSSSAAP